ncbi:MAG: hypothetical protein WCI72_03205, partial [archaeon]
FPETELSKRGNSMFLIFDSRYYPASNAEVTNGDNIYFGGLTFPLSRGRTLAEEEATYLKRNSKSILEEVAKIEKQVEKTEEANSLLQQLSTVSEINFFLKNIAREDNPLQRTTTYIPVNLSELPTGDFSLDNISIMPNIVSENFLAVNSRLYPIRGIDKPSIVYFGGSHYTLGRSTLTLAEAEKQFQTRLAQELKLRAIARSSKCREIHQEIENLKGENDLLVNQLGVRVTPYSYESGNEGYDLTLRRIYAPLIPHYNYTSEKSYSVGQSAVSLPLNKGVLGTDLKFVERQNANSPFSIHPHANCYGDLKLHGPTMEDHIIYLREAVTTVEDKQAFYQLTSTSSDSSESGY